MKKEVICLSIVVSLCLLQLFLAVPTTVAVNPITVTAKDARITVVVGTTVRAYAHLTNPNPEAITVNIKLEIRRDIIDADDSTKLFLTKSASVPSGDSFVDMGTFVANELTYTSGKGKLRQYFMKCEVDGKLIWDPTSENGYGPNVREAVYTIATAVDWVFPGNFEA